MTGRRRLQRLIVISWVAQLIFTGCSPSAAPVTTTPTTPPLPAYGGPSLPDLTLDPVQLSDEMIMKDVARAAVVDGLLIMSGLDQDGSSAVAAVDLRTGEPSWQGPRIADTVEIPAGSATIVSSDAWTVDTADGPLVIEHYFRAPCGDDPCSRSGTGYTPEQGLIALSAADRTVQWSEPTLPKLQTTDPDAVTFANLSPRTVAATAQVIVVNLGGDAINGTEPGPDSGPTRTIGYDPKTGRKLWSRDGVLTQQTADDRVLAVEPGATDADDRLIALDPRTGKTLWRLADDRPGSWIAAQGELAVAQLCENACNSRRSQLVSVADGTITTADIQQDSVALGTDGAGDSFAAWASNQAAQGQRLASREGSDPEPVAGQESLAEGSSAHAAVDGYVWLRTADDRVYPTDRTGARRSEPVPGAPRLVNDSYLLVDDDRDPGISLYSWRA